MVLLNIIHEDVFSNIIVDEFGNFNKSVSIFLYFPNQWNAYFVSGTWYINEYMKKLDVLVTGGGDNKSSDLSMVLFSGLILSYKPIKTINRGIMNRRIVGAGSEDEKINEYESYNVFIPGAPSKESCLYNCMMK